MKLIIGIALIVLNAYSVFAQEMSISKLPDTLTFRDLVFPRPENSLWQARSFLPLDLADSTTIANLPPGFLRNELLSEPMMNRSGTNVSSGLKLQWQAEDRYKFLRSALGYIQAGGAAYLLYKAQKKYHYIR
jgi:hypothetical protein